MEQDTINPQNGLRICQSHIYAFLTRSGCVKTITDPVGHSIYPFDRYAENRKFHVEEKSNYFVIATPSRT